MLHACVVPSTSLQRYTSNAWEDFYFRVVFSCYFWRRGAHAPSPLLRPSGVSLFGLLLAFAHTCFFVLRSCSPVYFDRICLAFPCLPPFTRSVTAPASEPEAPVEQLQCSPATMLLALTHMPKLRHYFHSVLSLAVRLPSVLLLGYGGIQHLYKGASCVKAYLRSTD